MASFRDTSSFPRHYEVQTRCLMTTLLGQSGNDVALAYEPSETPDLEAYTFLRLTSCSFSDNSTRSRSFNPERCSGLLGWNINNELNIVPSWSTPTSVGKAGWTHVVIQGGPRDLLDVSNGRSAALVNASINDVLEADSGSRFRLYWLGGATLDGGVCGHPGYREMNNSSISCPSFNEVTI